MVEIPERDVRQGEAVVPVMVISGPVGVGKTTTAYALSDLLAERNIRHAVIDHPQIGFLRPPPEDDEWNDEVTNQNLACMWTNYRNAGAERLIVSRVLGYISSVRRIETAVPGARVIVVRLRAPLDVIQGRIYGRNHADPEWYLTAASELSRSLDEQPIEDHLIENGALSITETAREVLRVTRWADLDRPDAERSSGVIP